jgi:(p)ppGpp synthase/HD superfamily hydrolase
MRIDGRRASGLDRKLARAVEFASLAHDGQVRKSTTVPYAAHSLGVASLVLEGGGTQREAIAALLHDVLEDTDVGPRVLRKRFGRKVTSIVVACSDFPSGKRKRGKEKRDASTWRERKVRSLKHLADPGTSKSVLRVRAADALYNARATVADLRRFGPETWERFNAGAIDQLWYYRSLSVLLSSRLPGMLADELRVTVRAMEQLAGWWFDIGDPQSV